MDCETSLLREPTVALTLDRAEEFGDLLDGMRLLLDAPALPLPCANRVRTREERAHIERHIEPRPIAVVTFWTAHKDSEKHEAILAPRDLKSAAPRAMRVRVPLPAPAAPARAPVATYGCVRAAR